mmetsp:Transcript_2787/g.8557  ORF Transcript_2787/g.8557 Transcript_2787/m.8557 type:complete len:141 (+) Transcript_2787:2553-2975(+)
MWSDLAQCRVLVWLLEDIRRGVIQQQLSTPGSLKEKFLIIPDTTYDGHKTLWHLPRQHLRHLRVPYLSPLPLVPFLSVSGVAAHVYYFEPRWKDGPGQASCMCDPSFASFSSAFPDWRWVVASLIGLAFVGRVALCSPVF